MKKIILFLLIFISINSFSCVRLRSPGNNYFVKGKKVYYQNIKITNADAQTFKEISYSMESCEYRDYAKDSKNVYFKNLIVEGADPESFMMLKQGYYKDKRYIYFFGKKLEGSDSQKDITFVSDNGCMAWGDGGCLVNNGIKYLNGKITK